MFCRNTSCLEFQFTGHIFVPFNPLFCLRINVEIKWLFQSRFANLFVTDNSTPLNEMTKCGDCLTETDYEPVRCIEIDQHLI